VAGGLLALPSNMGTSRDRSFALLPELDVTARLPITDRLSLNVGYHLLFLTRVYRTGQQIDRRIATQQLSPVLPVQETEGQGEAFPEASGQTSTLRAQGLSVGVHFVY